MMMTATSFADQTLQQTLVVLDAGLSDLSTLKNGLQPGAIALVLDSTRNGIDQITEALQTYPHINHLHILSHGAPGILYLGNSQLSLDTLDRYADQLQQWFTQDNGTLSLYGCQVAAGDAGIEFLEKLHQLTHANIAATTTLTGHPNQGGNWQLDVQLGHPNLQSAINEPAQHLYPGILAIKISGNYSPFPTNEGLEPSNIGIGGSVTISPDGQWVVYTAYDGERFTDYNNASDFSSQYAVSIYGGTSTFLRESSEYWQDSAAYYEISPDSSTFICALDTASIYGGYDSKADTLYTIPISGGNPTLTLNSLFSNSYGKGYEISADGSNLFFKTGSYSVGVDALYTVEIGSNSPTLLIDNFISYEISADGSTLVYIADMDSNFNAGLYSLPIGSSSPTLIIDDVVSYSFAISADASKIIYGADLNNDSQAEICISSINGGVPTLIDSNETNIFGIEVAPDGATIIYGGYSGIIGGTKLYSVPMNGGSPNLINGNFYDYKINPNSTTIAYTAQINNSATPDELYTVSVNGGTSTFVTDNFEEYKFSPDGSHILYTAYDGSGSELLYSVSSVGGNPNLITSNFGRYELSPDGSTLVYTVNVGSDTLLYSRPINGYTSTLITNDLRSQYSFEVSDSKIFYLAGQDINDYWDDELYSVPLNGGTSRRLNDPLAGDGYVWFFQATPDGNAVIYGTSEDGASELYSVNAELPTLTVSTTDATTTEGGSDTGAITLTRDYLIDDLTVAFNVAGTASLNDVGFSTGTVSGNQLLVTIPNGQDSVSVAITATDDAVVEPNESLSLTLANSSDYDVNPASNSSAITVVSNDQANITISDLSITEGNSGSQTGAVLVSLSNPASQPVVVSYVVSDGTATNGSDYLATNGTLTFSPGQTNASINVTVLGDEVVEGDETLQVVLSNPSVGSLSDMVGVVAIVNDDVAPDSVVDDPVVDDPVDPNAPTDGRDRMRGTNGRDRMRGLGGNDVLLGGNGDDVLLGDDGNDVLRGGDGKDKLKGGAGNDKLLGQDGNDVLIGNDGGDRIIGGDGNDRINAGFGNDTIIVKAGRDRIRTGTGRDVVSINQDGFAVILDFQDGRDKLKLIGSLRRVDFEDLDIIGRSNFTLIKHDGNRIAKLRGFDADDLSAADFA